MLNIKPQSECRWDVVSMGEVLLRFDPGDDRIQTARQFRVWEGGGEYNVARNLAHCFGQRAAVVTALADNPVGRLVEDLIRTGGVDTSKILWRQTDGISRTVRNGMYFMERGFGSRPPIGCSDRANTAISQIKPGDVDWRSVFEQDGTRWFHTGGIFAGLSETTAQVCAEGMRAARESGSIVSYDLNYRESLWSNRGGRDAANKLNSELLEFADVVFGVEDFEATCSGYSENTFRAAAQKLQKRFSNLKIIATTLRDVHSASKHSLAGVCFADGQVLHSRNYEDVDVLDRVGSGDAFASGLIYGMLSEAPMRRAVELGAGGAVLALSSPGDGLSASREEIERLAGGANDRTAVR